MVAFLIVTFGSFSHCKNAEDAETRQRRKNLCATSVFSAKQGFNFLFFEQEVLRKRRIDIFAFFCLAAQPQRGSAVNETVQEDQLIVYIRRAA